MHAGSISAQNAGGSYQFSILTKNLETNHNGLYKALETFTPLKMASEGKDIFIDADASVVKISRWKAGSKPVLMPAVTATVDKILYAISKIH